MNSFFRNSILALILGAVVLGGLFFWIGRRADQGRVKDVQEKSLMPEIDLGGLDYTKGHDVGYKMGAEGKSYDSKLLQGVTQDFHKGFMDGYAQGKQDFLLKFSKEKSSAPEAAVVQNNKKESSEALSKKSFASSQQMPKKKIAKPKPVAVPSESKKDSSDLADTAQDAPQGPQITPNPQTKLWLPPNGGLMRGFNTFSPPDGNGEADSHKNEGHYRIDPTKRIDSSHAHSSQDVIYYKMETEQKAITSLLGNYTTDVETAGYYAKGYNTSYDGQAYTSEPLTSVQKTLYDMGFNQGKVNRENYYQGYGAGYEDADGGRRVIPSNDKGVFYVAGYADGNSDYVFDYDDGYYTGYLDASDGRMEQADLNQAPNGYSSGYQTGYQDARSNKKPQRTFYWQVTADGNS